MTKNSTRQSFDVTARIKTFRFDDRVLFENLELIIRRNTWTCLLGVSGVGKSTMLKLVAGLTAGNASTEFECSDGAALAGRVAYMGQQDLLLPWLSVIDNVLLGDRLRNSPDAIRLGNAYELLDRVGLRAYAAELPAKLSGGMRQRAALVRTLMEDKPVVVMDEPFSALDAITRLKLQDMAADLLTGRCVFLVTHDPLEALRLGGHVLLMSGRPARLEQIAELSGATPRDATEQLVLDQQARILNLMRAEVT
ncbi:MAG: hypothetical protein CBD27_01875 [Rhodospirillaceae bacterium TMED167]|nr:ABC transporter ATP-binding protein [Rhodospirillaceae bacterium]OUW30240.1 MAG: hypothetical protein CBD27_01875 [Rhodospirillaceae bacterium TMED167]